MPLREGETHLQIQDHFKAVPRASETEKVKGVVYEAPCQECDAVYIGETGRNLELRLKEHKAAVMRQDKKNSVATNAWTK